ncbi:bifunctional enoyl-CoA hydratase/phosphate acetyltransferase [Ovoidimarina sediminis]|uniref:bifunctional enoyl-CoA hydratase/phosphate acetyltransferase n=1 Tax=Ovoidimarina sediminis TaxID=3079856 RepID=UPI00290D3B44|nr:bifunctional enoyl-CoA hydratase/phosphate acetyltransferase [Rhodophyticola sp. MJ-SS7]MDU8943731.1 bifunctional enoyl-CoA hydratase/phosphate acetyltransferase [Rhodophyticola sp. MJ-SS7]
MRFIENMTFEEIEIGTTAELTTTLRPGDIARLATMSGDANPAHTDVAYESSEDFRGFVTHGIWGTALITSLLATELPGPGARYVGQALSFDHPVDVGDTVTVRLRVASKDESRGALTLDCTCTNQNGLVVISGTVDVLAPSEKIRRPRAALPVERTHQPGVLFREWIARTAGQPATPTAVVHPCDALSLGGAMAAAAEGMIEPILVGPAQKIEATAEAAGLSLDGVEIIDAPHSHAAAEQAVALVREGRAGILMKGKLHTDELMGPVVDRDTGLRTERRMSHVFGLDVPHYPKPLFITDAALNIFPDLDTKRDIVQNAIDLAHALGIAQPRVAILSAVETVYSKVPSTIEAAALCKMLDRGQITGGIIDGPLAFDNAVSKSAALSKGIASDVAGEADILVVPDLEAGNMIAKQLVYLAGADAAGIVLGARIPIVLTSRADGISSRLASAAMAQLLTLHSTATAG